MGRTLGDLAFETHEIRVPQNLQPRVSDGQLDELAARLDVDLPAPFRDLYRWRNGHIDPDAPEVLSFLGQRVPPY